MSNTEFENDAFLTRAKGINHVTRHPWSSSGRKGVAKNIIMVLNNLKE